MPYRRASFALVKRRRLGLAFGAAAAIAVGAVAIAAGAGDSRPDALAAGPTWRNVAPVFAEKCAGCHTPGGIAPFSLRNARTAAAHADAILVMTELGRMPPWMPGHDSPTYLGQARRILTPAEKKLIAHWVHGGARIGAGDILAENLAMQRLCVKLGFHLSPAVDQETVRATIDFLQESGIQPEVHHEASACV